MIRLTLTDGPGRPDVPVLLPIEQIAGVSPSKPTEPDGTTYVCLRHRIIIGGQWREFFTAVESLAEIEAALAGVGEEIARPATQAPERGGLEA